MEKKEIAFYCIKLINVNGVRGWLYDSKDGIQIITGGMHANITQFSTQKEAERFIRDRKLERQGTKAYVRTNQDIIDEAAIIETKGVFKIKEPLFSLQNQLGHKLFYDSKKEEYFFKPDVVFGYPAWKNEADATQFVQALEFKEGAIFVVKHQGHEPDQKKLIQVYGILKGKEEQGPQTINVDNQEWEKC